MASELKASINISEETCKNETDRFSGLNIPAFFVVYLIILMVGIIGNCLILVLFSCESYRHFSFSVYLKALAISDTLVLIVNLIEDIDGKFLDHIMYTFKILCPFNLFFSYFGKLLSSYLLVVLSVDRYIAVVHPLKRASLCTFKRALWITGTGISIITLICLIISLWEVVELTTIPEDNRYQCPLIDEHESFSIFGIVMFFGFVVTFPFVIVATLNLSVFISIRSSLKVPKTSRKSSSVQMKATMSLILATFLSVLLNLPLALFEILESFAGVESHFAFNVTNITTLLNYSANFYVVVCHSREYRMTLWRAVRYAFCRSSDSKTSRNMTENNSEPKTQDSDLFAVSASI